MAGRRSRQKGVTGEQQVVRILRETFGGEWSRKKIGVPGPDIDCPASFPFCVEVKNDASLKAIHIYKGFALLEKYWKQASAQADALDKYPLLVCKMEGVWLCSPAPGEWYTLEKWCAAMKHELSAVAQ